MLEVFSWEIDGPITQQAPMCAKSGFETVVQLPNCLLRVHPLLGTCYMLAPPSSGTVAHRLLISGWLPVNLHLTLASGTRKCCQRMLFSRLKRSESASFNGWVPFIYNLVLQVNRYWPCVGKRHRQKISLPAMGSATGSCLHEGMFF